MRMGGDVVVVVGYLLRRGEKVGRHMIRLVGVAVGVVYGRRVSGRWVGGSFDFLYILFFSSILF